MTAATVASTASRHGVWASIICLIKRVAPVGIKTMVQKRIIASILSRNSEGYCFSRLALSRMAWE